MTPDDRAAFLMSGLKAGILSASLQSELSAWIEAREIKFKVMRTTLDEIYQNEREQDALDRVALLPNATLFHFPPRGVFASDSAS